VVLAGLGALLIVVGSTAQKDPPTAPSPAAAGPVLSAPNQPSESDSSTVPNRPTVSPVEPAITGTGATPIRITIPAIDVNANVLVMGLNANRTVQVPALSQVRDAGWYKFSPVPGAVGPSIILGHIDSAQYGLGVFFRLGDVRPGNVVTILRADHMLATFSVTSVAEYPKTAFPTKTVYGNTAGPALRLITCGGRFNSSTGSYLDNIVAYGALVSLVHV
jgi:sortase (surface protein transpeptidase)